MDYWKSCDLQAVISWFCKTILLYSYFQIKLLYRILFCIFVWKSEHTTLEKPNTFIFKCEIITNLTAKQAICASVMWKFIFKLNAKIYIKPKIKHHEKINLINHFSLHHTGYCILPGLPSRRNYVYNPGRSR